MAWSWQAMTTPWVVTEHVADCEIGMSFAFETSPEDNVFPSVMTFEMARHITDTCYSVSTSPPSLPQQPMQLGRQYLCCQSEQGQIQSDRFRITVWTISPKDSPAKRHWRLESGFIVVACHFWWALLGLDPARIQLPALACFTHCPQAAFRILGHIWHMRIFAQEHCKKKLIKIWGAIKQTKEFDKAVMVSNGDKSMPGCVHSWSNSEAKIV